MLFLLFSPELGLINKTRAVIPTARPTPQPIIEAVIASSLASSATKPGTVDPERTSSESSYDGGSDTALRILSKKHKVITTNLLIFSRSQKKGFYAIAFFNPSLYAEDMKAIDSGKDKVKKICDVLKKETLEPAKNEAKALLLEAEEKAASMLAAAKAEAEKELENAREKIEQEKRVFEASLSLASKQALGALRQEITTKLLGQGLDALVDFKTPETSGKLLETLLTAISKEGLDANLEVALAKGMDKDALIKFLGGQAASLLQSSEVVAGAFAGGVRVKMKEAQMTVDLTEQTVKELLTSYVREDFRELVLKS